jgi:hypothetical protein
MYTVIRNEFWIKKGFRLKYNSFWKHYKDNLKTNQVNLRWEGQGTAGRFFKYINPLLVNIIIQDGNKLLIAKLGCFYSVSLLLLVNKFY